LEITVEMRTKNINETTEARLGDKRKGGREAFMLKKESRILEN